MFGTYLYRELTSRKKQTAIIAIGMAIAIALVIVVNSVAAGVRDAQASVLSGVYGVGTDVTISQPAAAPQPGDGPPAFDFASGAGTTADGTTALSQTRLAAVRGTTTFDSSALDTALSVDNVSAATAILALENSTFSGQMPDPGQAPTPGSAPPAGGADGAGGSAFSIDQFTVDGIDVSGPAVGPLTAATLSDGRAFTSDDIGASVVVLDSAYATSVSLVVGDTLAIGGSDFEVIGLVASASSDAATAANAYIPLDVAQTLSGLDGQISSVYVQAASSQAIPQVKADLETALPDATVNTQADLAASVSGSLSTASDLVTNLGTWLSLLVLAAAFLMAILLTISGVTRRTREFGTLKAIGWSNQRIVGQVAGESLVQGALGGLVGIALALGAIAIINIVAPTLTATAAVQATGPGGPGGFGGPPGSANQTAAAASEIALTAPVSWIVIAIAVGLAILGGLLAGAIGGWRAARLRPAEALRSVA